MDKDSNTPSLVGDQLGYVGLKINYDQVVEDSRIELQWPNNIRTYSAMANDAAIAPAISLFEKMVSQVEWRVEAPANCRANTKKRAALVSSMMNDMDHSWYSFIRESSSALTFGFSVHEKVWRKRLFSEGSKYNDGLWGIQALPVRSQATISGWVWDDYGRSLTHVKQDPNLLVGDYANFKTGATGEIEIPRNRFLLFRTDISRDSPIGVSPLNAVYVHWRILKEIRETEAIGIQKDLNGLVVISLPPSIMSKDANSDEKSVYEYFKNVGRNIQVNEQGSVLLPSAYDPDTSQPIYDIKLLSNSGSKSYDTNAIIQRYSNEILQTLFADILKLGSTNSGSYSLADSKTSLVEMAVKTRLQERRDVLNQDLMRQIFIANDWPLDELPTFEFGDISGTDIATFAKALQQLKATGLIVPSAKNLNYIAEVLNLPDRLNEKLSIDEVAEMTGNSESKSGSGYASDTGGLNGTADTVAVTDNSANNLENK